MIIDDKSEIERSWCTHDYSSTYTRSFWCKDFDDWQEATTYLEQKIHNAANKVYLYLGNDGPIYETDARLVLQTFPAISNYLRQGNNPFILADQRGFWGYGLDCVTESRMTIFKVFGWLEDEY